MNNKHILVVDDEPKLAFFLGKALERSNPKCRVSVANSSEEALEIAAQTAVDLLITDLRMPGINGLELIQRLRRTSPKMRMILMTAFGSAEVEKNVLSLQISRYLTKPFHLKDLLDAASQTLADMEISQDGVLVVSDRQFEAMSAIIRELIRDTGIECVHLADLLGQVLLTEGATPDIETAPLVALFATGFSTVFEVARFLKDDTPLSLRYYEGKRHGIYVVNIDTALLMLLIGVRTQRSQLGTVWHYSRRAAEKLAEIISAGQEQHQAIQQSMDELEDGFGDSLMAELDNVLGERPDKESPFG